MPPAQPQRAPLVFALQRRHHARMSQPTPSKTPCTRPAVAWKTSHAWAPSPPFAWPRPSTPRAPSAPNGARATGCSTTRAKSPPGLRPPSPCRSASPAAFTSSLIASPSPPAAPRQARAPPGRRDDEPQHWLAPATHRSPAPERGRHLEHPNRQPRHAPRLRQPGTGCKTATYKKTPTFGAFSVAFTSPCVFAELR